MTRALSRHLALSLPLLVATPALAAEGGARHGENPDAELVCLCSAYIAASEAYDAAL